MATDTEQTSKGDTAQSFGTVLSDEIARFKPARTLHHAPAMSSAPILLGTVGLGLSGGGIRSATFSLGVLQALAREGRLASFDYVSTVSGGGYIGSWLSAWISRDKLKIVQDELAKRGTDGAAVPQTAEPAPIVWLRKYSNYLAPRVGLFSIDALTLMSIWLRNVLLNMLIVVSFMALIMLVPLLLLPFVPTLLHWDGLSASAYVLGLALLPLAICLNLTLNGRTTLSQDNWFMKTRGVLATVLGPGILAAIFGSFNTFGDDFGMTYATKFIKPVAESLAVAGVAWIFIQLWRTPGQNVTFARRVLRLIPDALVFAGAAMVAVMAVFALLCAERYLYSNGPAESEYDYIKLLTFGPPAFLVTFGLGGFIFVGLAGRAYFERSREWWGRLNAWFFIAGTVWFLAMATALYVPSLTKWTSAHAYGWVKALTGLGWLGSLLAALLGPKIKMLSQAASNNLMGVLNFAAFIVIIGLIIGLSTLTRSSLVLAVDHLNATAVAGASPSAHPPRAEICPPATVSHPAPCLMSFIESDIVDLQALRQTHMGYTPLTCVAFGICLLVMLLFGWRVDVNKFSLHNMYKNRLIRCYLGASRARHPHPFTGFDENDDIPLSSLSKQRPLHIVNTCLNLSQGENLAWQERKAASFVLTPVWCGFSLGKSQGDTTLKNSPHSRGGSVTPDYGSIPGFRPTDRFSGDDESIHPGFSLGMAMAVSGAAASPNMGATTRPALAFVMTLFDARLGRWTANPARKKWKRASPKFGLICLLQELFGWSNEQRNFVYLSDGGHFENLGLYELVRRRCSTIWIVDASADPDRNCDDLGRAIRQCRVDFGVEITLPLIDMIKAPPSLLPKSGFALGSIDYGPGFAAGILIYIKPTLCEGTPEPDDVLSYGKREPTFPHQTTADQFFDESQFESYRRLGLSIAEACLKEHKDTLPVVSV